MSQKKIKVLIIDDSALVRQLLTKIFDGDKDLEVIGVAADPLIAREKIKALKPDVLTLDVEMPRMDGLTFLENLMRLRPMPVVMISTLTEKGADVTLRALELGAIDFVSKPKLGATYKIEDYSIEICEKVKTAAKAHVRALTRKPATTSSQNSDAVIKKSAIKPGRFRTTDTIVAIGASTGGTEAIKEVLMTLPPNFPGVIITQHIPAAFSKPFAERVNQASAIEVCEASDGQQVLPGHAYIAPGDKHMLLERSGARYICRLNDGPPVNRHKPSVDVMFRSVAQNAGGNAIGVILTGMGADGAEGLKEMLEAGAKTIGQDENSSVVWGMPGAAFKIGAVQTVLPLNKVSETLVANAGEGGRI
ncbi:MAG: chemotaxis response regulator protein-glutamate methylesterase [Mariprofundaceae bacterium]